MRPALLLPAASALLTLSACQMTAPPSPGGPPPDVPAPPPPRCDEAALSAGFVGLPASVLAATTFLAPVRVIRPGDAVTMDYNPSRINFELDAADRIARVTCG